MIILLNIKKCEITQLGELITVLKQIILHVELFALALLLRTDIWIYSTEFGNEWMLFSGRGASLIDALTLPVVNIVGSNFKIIMDYIMSQFLV